MKKLLLGIFGLALLLPLGVNANTIDSVKEGENTSSHEVKIGNVDTTPIYEVYIYWENPVFDLIYNNETESYNWKPASNCNEFVDSNMEQYFESGKTFYSDDTCSTEVYEYDENIEHFFVKQDRETMAINIEDFSYNGRIVPSIEWNSEVKYNDVEGKFSYEEIVPVCSVIETKPEFEEAKTHATIYKDNSCINELIDPSIVTYERDKYYVKKAEREQKELTSKEIPDSARQSAMGGSFYEEIPDDVRQRNHYFLDLKLENKETQKGAITSGDAIGTITISIRVAE